MEHCIRKGVIYGFLIGLGYGIMFVPQASSLLVEYIIILLKLAVISASIGVVAGVWYYNNESKESKT